MTDQEPKVPCVGEVDEHKGEWIDMIFTDSDSSAENSDDEPSVKIVRWENINLNNSQHMKELRVFLYNNYTLTSPDYAPDFSEKFLSWALQPTGYDPRYHFGLRDENNYLVAFIGAVPQMIRLGQQKRRALTVMIMCSKRSDNVHEDYTVEMLNEMVNRGNGEQINYAIFTGTYKRHFYKSVAQLPLYERYLNVERLVESGYLSLTPDAKAALLAQQQELVELPLLAGVRPLSTDPANADTLLALRWIDKDNLRENHGDEMKNRKWYRMTYDRFLTSTADYPTVVTPIEGVISSFFVEKPQRQQPASYPFVSDFVSFYKVRQVSRQNPNAPPIMTAFLFHHAITPDTAENPWVTHTADLIGVAVKKAMEEGCDLFVATHMKDMGRALRDFQCVRMMQNKQKLYKRYYMFNGNFRNVNPKEVSLCLL